MPQHTPLRPGQGEQITPDALARAGQHGLNTQQVANVLRVTCNRASTVLCQLMRAGQAAGTAIASVIRLLLVALTAMQLGGCGGGDWPEGDTDVPRPGVDCQARPELCA
jgi:hypothetical protein